MLPQSQKVEPTDGLNNVHHTQDGDTRAQCNSLYESDLQVSKLVLIIHNLGIDIRERVFRGPSP